MNSPAVMAVNLTACFCPAIPFTGQPSTAVFLLHAVRAAARCSPSIRTAVGLQTCTLLRLSDQFFPLLHGLTATASDQSAWFLRRTRYTGRRCKAVSSGVAPYLQ